MVVIYRNIIDRDNSGHQKPSYVYTSKPFGKAHDDDKLMSLYFLILQYLVTLCIIFTLYIPSFYIFLQCILYNLHLPKYMSLQYTPFEIYTPVQIHSYHNLIGLVPTVQSKQNNSVSATLIFTPKGES